MFLKHNSGVFFKHVEYYPWWRGGTWRHRLELVLDESYPKLALVIWKKKYWKQSYNHVTLEQR